jgi:hypothetical protein
LEYFTRLENCGTKKSCTPRRRAHSSIVHWFGEHLEKPTSFTASKPPFYRKKSKAIWWVKDAALANWSSSWSINGISVRMLKADRVGYIVYEEGFQIVAEPFPDT